MKAGRKRKYMEDTTVLSIRVPVSKKEYLKQLILKELKHEEIKRGYKRVGILEG